LVGSNIVREREKARYFVVKSGEGRKKRVLQENHGEIEEEEDSKANFF
jgi:hypothetical protein